VVNLELDKVLTKAIYEEDAECLIDFLFPHIKATPIQLRIIESIAFDKSKRLIISAMTRYGKTYSVAIAVVLYILFHRNKRILLIAPTGDQTAILRNYIADLLVSHPVFINMLDTDTTGAQRIKKEVSRSRITFKNGCEMKTLSAAGTAMRLMGHGGDLIILDESCLVPHSVYRQKIHRMLGDNPDSSLVEIGNPWHVDNQMYEHWCSPDFDKIRINDEIAISEGRLTVEFRDEQKLALTPREYRILYQALFPKDSEDVLIPREKIREAVDRSIVFNSVHPIKIVLSCDVARFGTDKNVIMIRKVQGELSSHLYVEEYTGKPTTYTFGRIVELDGEYGCDEIKIDDLGVGGGVTDMLMNTGLCTKVTAFIASSKDTFDVNDMKRFPNWKSKSYISLARSFVRDMISIPNHPELIQELSLLRIDYDNSGKLRILDFPKEREPVEGEKKSPNFSDALMINHSRYSCSGSSSIWA